MKAARAASASVLLQGATFKACPCCGTSITTKSPPGQCYLCKAETSFESEGDLPSSAVEQDLSDRIDDLDISLRRLSNSLKNQLRSLSEVQAKRTEISHSIDSARRSIESQYLQRARQLEGELGKLNERRRFLMRVRAMPADIDARMESADKLSADTLKLCAISPRRKTSSRGAATMSELWKRISKPYCALSGFLRSARRMRFTSIREPGSHTFIPRAISMRHGLSTMSEVVGRLCYSKFHMLWQSTRPPRKRS